MVAGTANLGGTESCVGASCDCLNRVLNCESLITADQAIAPDATNLQLRALDIGVHSKDPKISAIVTPYASGLESIVCSGRDPGSLWTAVLERDAATSRRLRSVAVTVSSDDESCASVAILERIMQETPPNGSVQGGERYQNRYSTYLSDFSSCRHAVSCTCASASAPSPHDRLLVRGNNGKQQLPHVSPGLHQLASLKHLAIEPITRTSRSHASTTSVSRSCRFWRRPSTSTGS